MSAMHAEVFEAFGAIDVPEDMALRAAASLACALLAEVGSASGPQPADAAALKSDVATIAADGPSVRADVAAVKNHVTVLTAAVAGLKSGMTRVEGELALLKGMMGFGLAFPVAITSKLFLH